MKERPLHFHEFGRILIGWRLSSDGKWALNGKVVRFKAGMIRDEYQKAFRVIFFPIIFSIGIIAVPTTEGEK